ncbi:MAG: alginate lyase family protein [Pyrinomonadaceae bacterium]
MSISTKFKTVFRGDISLTDLPREFLRRKKAIARQNRERRDLKQINSAPARLLTEFASRSSAELLTHFRERKVSFFPLDDLERIKKLHSDLFPQETVQIVDSANRIVRESTWELAGLGAFEFKAENFWRHDPLTGKDWGLEYHADDVVVYREDGADIRILWELNRFGHALTLANAFALTRDEIFAETFFVHVDSWMPQNQYALGANWSCAMEVALRAVNLLAAFDIFRYSKALNEERLSRILQLFDQHGRFILDNNEFSYITTSNHYLSDVVGLFWIGTLFSELQNAAEWKKFGLAEILREMDKQILPDGADFEASTGYHKFVTELFLYSFLLAKRNGVEIPQKYWDKLRQMLDYIHAIMRPDGNVPLIGDGDGSQIVPLIKRDADDQSYLLALAAIVFDEPKFKQQAKLTPEILWLLGEDSVTEFRSMKVVEVFLASAAFPDAGAYIMRDGDLYLHFNASDCGLNGRGSHGHNDALSIEISAFGREFIVDPGSFAYNLDREARHQFRSTAYHSTVMIDGEEQRTTNAELPFIIGNEAKPFVDDWQTSMTRDRVSAVHFGYERLKKPITHRRTVEFSKTEKYWLIEDKLTGTGRHKFNFAFHLSPGLEVACLDHNIINISDNEGRHLYICAKGIDSKPEIVPSFVSRNYGHKENSSILTWEITAAVPFITRFVIVPASSAENSASRLELLKRLTDNIES